MFFECPSLRTVPAFVEKRKRLLSGRSPEKAFQDRGEVFPATVRLFVPSRQIDPSQAGRHQDQGGRLGNSRRIVRVMIRHMHVVSKRSHIIRMLAGNGPVRTGRRAAFHEIETMNVGKGHAQRQHEDQ
jgi:hypothetical protein